MKPKHHSLTIEAAKNLVNYWQAKGIIPVGIDIGKVATILSTGRNDKDMSKWVAEIDDIEDVKVPSSLAGFLIDRISNATSFQHFSYCGALGDLKDAQVVVKQYDGYCWDCDPFLGWYEEIANMSWADVKYDIDCGDLPNWFLENSPGAKCISGQTDWDDQKYPSALDLAEFYQTGGTQFNQQSQQTEFLKSLSFGIHMLQDMVVPHHILCTIMEGHSVYEAEMLSYWNKFYTSRTHSTKYVQLENHVSPMVLDLLEKYFKDPADFRQIGQTAMALTEARLIDGKSIPPASKPEALAYTTLAIAVTLKAINVY